MSLFRNAAAAALFLVCAAPLQATRYDVIASASPQERESEWYASLDKSDPAIARETRRRVAEIVKRQGGKLTASERLALAEPVLSTVIPKTSKRPVPVIGEAAEPYLAKLGPVLSSEDFGERGSTVFGRAYEFADTRFGADRLRLFVSRVSGRFTQISYAFSKGVEANGMPSMAKTREILTAVAPGRLWQQSGGKWVAEDCEAFVLKLDGSGEDGVPKHWKSQVIVSIPAPRR